MALLKIIFPTLITKITLDNRQQIRRIWKLVGATLVWASLVYFVDGRFGPHPLWNGIFNPDKIQNSPNGPNWKDIVQTVVILLGLPPALLLWHWRDTNKLAEIHHTRKDINLKEFQEVQLRAAGSFDLEKLGAESCEQLQIAALHQLRGFLRGEYGDAFRRPAFELLLAGHASAMERNGIPKSIRNWSKGKDRGDAKEYRNKLQNALVECRSRLTTVDRERLGILRDEADAILYAGFPLRGRVFDLVQWHNRDFRSSLKKRLNISGASFIGAELWSCKLTDTIMWNVNLQGAQLWGAKLARVDFTEAHLEGAQFLKANFNGANLYGTHLECAMLDFAIFTGANLTGAKFDAAQLFDVMFDSETVMTNNWDELSYDDREEYFQTLRDRGARHVDEPKPDWSTQE